MTTAETTVNKSLKGHKKQTLQPIDTKNFSKITKKKEMQENLVKLKNEVRIQ